MARGQEAQARPTQPRGESLAFPRQVSLLTTAQECCRDQRLRSMGSADQGCARRMSPEEKPLPLPASPQGPRSPPSFRAQDPAQPTVSEDGTSQGFSNWKIVATNSKMFKSSASPGSKSSGRCGVAEHPTAPGTGLERTCLRSQSQPGRAEAPGCSLLRSPEPLLEPSRMGGSPLLQPDYSQRGHGWGQREEN